MTFRVIILPLANEEMEQLYEWMTLHSEAGENAVRHCLSNWMLFLRIHSNFNWPQKIP
jgi:hypothetical protein